MMSSSSNSYPHQQIYLPFSPTPQYADQIPSTPTSAGQNSNHTLTTTITTATTTIVPTSLQSPLDQFFSQHPNFTPTPTTAVPPADWSIHQDFARLCQQEGWASNSRRYKNAKRQFREALIAEFNYMFGMNDKDLSNWQRLCRVVGVPEERIPKSLTQCRRMLSTIHVNLLDLVETRYAGRGTPKKFQTLTALGTYIRDTGRCFPREARSRGILGRLLRELRRG